MLSTHKVSPAPKGTKRLHEQCGERLHCSRYHYNHPLRKLYKTVELINEEKDLTLHPMHPQRSSACAANWLKWNYSAGSSELAVNEIEHGCARTFATINSSR